MQTVLANVGIEHTPHKIGRNVSVKGKLKLEEPISIEGFFKGTIKSTSIVAIAESAEVTANIEADIVIVAGKLEGDILADNQVFLLDTCRMKGSIRTSRISIADNAVFEGECQMLSSPEEVDIFSYTVEQLSNNLKRL
ncbi:polymer-forming cytoskeletal protein [Spirochaetia bacterium 38H-sp]|uniref:Polymer-forming cytoskeletal protein n=1 Tax=Rarispira pelagica TaxID=3141764 RepID=A0ABU9UAC2_9SPIR